MSLAQALWRRIARHVVPVLFVGAVPLIVLGTSVGFAQHKLDNQSNVDAAMKELEAAERQAQDNIPNNQNFKGAEDALDAAIRRNEETPDQPVAAKQKAQQAQDAAQTRADDWRGRTTPDQVERANRYRDALRQRREARKKLKQEYPAVRNAAAVARQQGYTDVQGFLLDWVSRIDRAIRRAETVITAPTQTAGVVPRTQRIQLTSAEPRLFPDPGQTQLFTAVTVSGSGGALFGELPERGFIAIEQAGSGVQQLNQIRPTRSANGAVANFKIEADNAPVPRARTYINFNYFDMKASSSGGAFDPGAGHFLNIPGPQGGASGFFLGFNPLNRAVDIFFSNNTQSFGGNAGVRLPFLGSFEGGGGVDVIVGAGGNRLTMDESFGGRIPGFIRDFSYVSSVDVNSAVLDLGIGITRTVITQGGGIFMLSGDLIVSPTYLSASGTDTLNFTGFNPSSADLSKSKGDVAVNFSGTARFGLPGSTIIGNQISGTSIFVKGGYESRPGFPVIVRDGVGPSRVDLKHADIFNVGGGLAITFGGPSPNRTLSR